MTGGRDVTGAATGGLRRPNGRRRVAKALAIVLAVAALLATPTPASAQCSQQCRWTVVMGKCTTILGATVPCPLRKKVCGERICTQRFS